VDDLHTDLVLDVVHAAHVVERDPRPFGSDRFECVGLVVYDVRMGWNSLALRIPCRERSGELGVGQRRVELDSARVALARLVGAAVVQDDAREEQLRACIVRVALGQSFGEDARLAQLAQRKNARARPSCALPPAPRVSASRYSASASSARPAASSVAARCSRKGTLSGESARASRSVASVASSTGPHFPEAGLVTQCRGELPNGKMTRR
jgi:hypothetical protein